MPQGRKIVYFLGAGASLGAGAHAVVQHGGHVPIPTQATFWSTFLRFCGSNKRRRLIESFLFRYFLGYQRSPARLVAKERRQRFSAIDVEEVFTFLSERTRAPSTSPQFQAYAQKVWDALVPEIGTVFRHFKPSSITRRLYRQLRGNHIRSRDVVVSFNYDTVFEDSLPRNVKWAYECLETKKRCLRILKPHGSINWRADKETIVVDKTTTSCVVIAPTHLKFVKTTTHNVDGGPQLEYCLRNNYTFGVISETVH